jgi:ABC-type multidrug transport system ATPase subunit/ABC-type multidrug transport system permease subunit
MPTYFIIMELENIRTQKTQQAQFTFMWKNISYEIIERDKRKNGDNKRTLINNVSGYAKSGEVTAIMGPSGCGKSSLLNFLTHRINFPKGSSHSGDAYINSEKVPFQKIAEVSSYVMQDDLLFDILTPRETLFFVAKLKYNKPDNEIAEMVDNLLSELKLTKCKDVRIGNEMRKGISGGERKRTSIGMEIMSNPSIMFLDEPTSGLDTQTSFTIIEYLKDLAAKQNKAVIFAIHQPSSNIFGLFDRLLLMNKGEAVYQGKPIGVINHFNSLGIPLSSRANPADAFMHKMEEQNALIERGTVVEMKLDYEEGNIKEIKKLKHDKTLMENYREIIEPKINAEMEAIIQEGEKCNVISKKEEKTGFWNEFKVLTKRTFTNVLRNPIMIRVRLLTIFASAFIDCSIFYNMGKDQVGTQNRMGFIFHFTNHIFMTTLFAAVMAFPMERAVFIREHSGRMYGVLPYYLSKNVIEAPIMLFMMFIYGAIIYYLINLNANAINFFVFLGIYTSLSYCSQSLGLFFGATFSNFHFAMLVTQACVLPTQLFSGFIINQNNMPVWLAWIRYLSFFRYSIEGAMRNEFDEPSNYAFNPVENLNLDIGLWQCVAIMIGIGTCLRILGFFSMKLLVKKVG